MLRSSLGGRGVWRRMDTCMCMAESFYCSPEAVTTLLISYALRVQPCSTLCDPTDPQTVACQVPLSMGFSRQEYWSGLPFPPPGDLPNPGIEPSSAMSPVLQADALLLSHQKSPRKEFASENLAKGMTGNLLLTCSLLPFFTLTIR